MIHSGILVAVMALMTVMTRALPFLVFHGETPPYISYLGRALPPAIIGMLVIYCLKDVSVAAAPHGLPELIAGLSVVLIHIWKRNSLLSILSGTIIYMMLVQLVF